MEKPREVTVVFRDNPAPKARNGKVSLLIGQAYFGGSTIPSKKKAFIHGKPPASAQPKAGETWLCNIIIDDAKYLTVAPVKLLVNEETMVDKLSALKDKFKK
jgi:hypothetical protein